MALESVTTIYDLNVANPTATDPVSQADDHLRNLKTGILASFAGSTGANDYQKIGKMIVQWGTATTGAGTSTITYPIPFPNATRAVIAGNRTSSTAGITIYAGNAGTTTFDLASSSGAGLGVYWIAIGY